MTENLQKYNEIFKECFNLEEDALHGALVYNSIPTWDSIGHMRMIATLEDTFDIMLETEDILDFSSYEKGKIILAKYEVAI